MDIDHVCVGYGVTAENKVGIKLVRREIPKADAGMFVFVASKLDAPSQLNVLIDVEVWGGDTELIAGEELIATRDVSGAIHLCENWPIAVARYWKARDGAKSITEEIDDLRTTIRGYRLRCHAAEQDAALSNRAIEQWRQRDKITTGRLDAYKAHAKELGGLLPLIEAYGSKCAEAEANRGYRESLYEEADAVLEQIKATLKPTR